MMFQIIYDIRYFLVVLLLVLVGFTQAFWLLYGAPAVDFLPILQASFFFMMGIADVSE